MLELLVGTPLAHFSKSQGFQDGDDFPWFRNWDLAHGQLNVTV
jgi:hypothetical protein